MTITDELDRLFGQVLHSIPKPEPLCNQCDGCQANMPVVNGTHRSKHSDFHGIHMCCQKQKYIDPIDADETNYGVCAQGESDEQ